MKYIIIFVTITFSATGLFAKDCVILLHGLARNSSSMKPIARRLEKEGYDAYSIGYPSTKYKIEKLSRDFVAKEINKVVSTYGPDDKIFFVTHSMGGIILRYLVANSLTRCDGVVMLCPPNRGSALVSVLQKKSAYGWLFRKLNGPAGEQLEKGMSIFSKLSSLANCPVGIIAGDKTWEPLHSHWIPGVDDGKVSIEETKLEQMDDFIILHHTHTFIMNSSDTHDQIVKFLKTGSFNHSE